MGNEIYRKIYDDCLNLMENIKKDTMHSKDCLNKMMEIRYSFVKNLEGINEKDASRLSTLIEQLSEYHQTKLELTWFDKF